MDLDALRSVYVFAGLPQEQLATLIRASTEVAFATGDVLWHEGTPAEYWWVLLEGRIELMRRTPHSEPTVAALLEHPGDWGGGFRAWSPAGGYFTSGRGAIPGRVLRVPSAALRDLTLALFPLGAHLLDGMFQTIINFEATSRQQQAMAALGQLAAGLAHELNTPASAATRSVEALQTTTADLLQSTRALARESMSAEQFAVLDDLRLDIGLPIAAGDSVRLAAREDELTSWLEERGVDSAWRVAPSLAAAGADIAWCERAAAVLPRSLLTLGLDWVANALTMESLITEVKESTGRISALVNDMRSYTQLDRAPHQIIDVTEGLDSTVVMLKDRLRGVTVVRDYERDLPSIEAIPGELNQVWTNLIVNAIDAMGGSGTLRLSARAGTDDVIVDVTDTGPGMPSEVRDRAFDPFFTTKDVGKGTGLGLDIARRIVVDRHHGSIDIDSRPGATVFRVQLPRQFQRGST